VVNRNRKKNIGRSFGGHQQYRRPLTFGPKKEKERKKIQLPRIPIKSFLFIILILVIIYFVFISGKFKIKEIIVEGNNTIVPEVIEGYVPKNTNILYFSIKKTKAKILSEHTEINDIVIYKGLPDTIKIVVVEHENRLVWQASGKNYLISTQGIVSKEILTLDGVNMPVVVDSKNLSLSLGKGLVSPSFVAFILNINDKFFESTNIKPKNFEVGETTFDLNLYTEAGFYVKFNTLRSSAKQLDNLKKVLVEKRQDIKEYIDLRVDGWAYYK
jgi:cell division septal protein FtsQ